ncbi:MAG: class I SAM-dependent methyltransferase [Haloarculaceae archaeon]
MKDAVRGNFDESVTAYDAYERRTRRFSSLARLLWAEMRRRSERSLDTVLDAGAGSGASTGVLEGGASTLVALDISRGMLQANDAGTGVQGDLDSLPLVGGSLDAIAYTASLFLVPEPELAIREAARVLRPGGVVGAVVPVGWFDDDGRDVFASLGRESRSPADPDDVIGAVSEAFDTVEGTWRFASTADDIRLFHTIPALGARLYPRATTEDRARNVRDLLEPVDGTYEERWRWVVGSS